VRRGKWIAAVTFIVLGIGGLAAWAIASPGAVAYYKTPTEVRAMPNAGDRILKVGGRVQDGSLHRAGTGVRFVITDGEATVAVRYRGEIPDTLKDGTDAVAEGRIAADGTLNATRVLAKCSSKYVPKGRPGDLGHAALRRP
jgi:cytochrome c-type biogenesis protein CcmE